MSLSWLDDEVDDFGLLDEEVGDGFELFAHADAVEGLVALGAGAPDGGAAGGVEQAELDAAGVGDFAHDAAEGVDLADEVALGDAADGGVAGHLRDEVEVQGEEGGAQAHARGGGRGFAAGVAGADDEDVELFGKARYVEGFGEGGGIGLGERVTTLYFRGCLLRSAECRRLKPILRGD